MDRCHQHQHRQFFEVSVSQGQQRHWKCWDLARRERQESEQQVAREWQAGQLKMILLQAQASPWAGDVVSDVLRSNQQLKIHTLFTMHTTKPFSSML